jgi:hypothetical protein
MMLAASRMALSSVVESTLGGRYPPAVPETASSLAGDATELLI